MQRLERVELCSGSLVHDEPADTQCRMCADKSWGHVDLGAEPAWHFPGPVLSYRAAFSTFPAITEALVAPV